MARALACDLPRSTAAESREKRREMLLVMPPAPNRAAIERLANLPMTYCRDSPLRAMEIEARRFPVQPQKLDQPSALALEVGDQRIVVDLDHVRGEQFQPVRCQALDFPTAAAAVGEIIR